MEEKILTIVIPMYNMEKYIDACLSSLVFGDGMERLEVLVINDGSKDGCSAMAHSYEERHPQTFRVIDKENGNYGSCINRGLQEATGRYVKVLDADDFFDTPNLGAYLQFLEAHDLDMVYTPFSHIDEQGRTTWRSRVLLSERRTYGLKQLFPRLHMAMHNITYRTDILRRIQYHQTEGISYTDQEWIFLPMAYVECWQYYAHNIYVYRTGREGQSMSPGRVVRSMGQEIQGIEVMVGHYVRLENNLSDLQKAYLQNRLMVRAKVIYKAYLLRYHRELKPSLDELIWFDNWLHEGCPEIWELTNRLTYHIGPFPYHFVRSWRQNDYNTELLGLCLKRK